MSRDKHQGALRRSLRAPAKKVLHLERLTVFVNPEETDVEVVTRVLEIIDIAAEGGDGAFRREHQTDIGVFPVSIEMIEAALVERDHVAAQPRRLERVR